MGNINPVTTSFNLPDGQEVVIETGKLATQAHGSVVVKIGKTMLFCSVVSNYEMREGQAFFPLSVDYQEKFASVGRIPGNFFRRETRLNDYEILICRLVDRAIRPLFPDGYMNETQVIINLISADDDTLPDAYAALATSAAIMCSDIPWAGPISEVRVAKINGEYVVNPGRAALETATMEILVGATYDNVTMVEGEGKEMQESELIDAIKVGHDFIKIQCKAQMELAKLVGDKAIKRELVEAPKDDEVLAFVKEFASEGILTVAKGKLNKKQRKNGLKDVSLALAEAAQERYSDEEIGAKMPFVKSYFDKVKKELIRAMMLETGQRLDGRVSTDVRNIWSEIDYLPSAHGSAVFTRGETQALMSLTLGTKLDKQMIDTALSMSYEKFILHYNFPAFSVGEIKPMRGPGRREVGHANLAARSLKQVIAEDMPYTIRLVSDILESNGSSSMATVCAGSLALQDAGIKIERPVSGIAMGMISEGDNHMILSDILGDEDALGDMDFKVTGTTEGITGCQMDIKIDGMPYDLLERALDQAKAGRLHILNEMGKTISEAREDLKPHAPRMVELSIDKSFIGAVIGPGGKIIQDIQEKTGTVINIEEDGDRGIVSISSSNKAGIDEARARIEDITFEPSVGDVYDAIVASIMPYGAFVDFKGKSGLLHVSEISHTRINDVSEVLSEGDTIKVKLIGVDPKNGKMRLSAKAILPRPEKEN